MDGIVVKRFYGGNSGDDRCRLSVLSPVDLSTKVACVDLSLPSYIDDQHITCGSCFGWLYFNCFGSLCFNDYEDNIVLCNLTTKQLKPLPPLPESKPPFKLIASGLGYDSKSDDFKVVRFLRQGGRLRGYNVLYELYSLKSGVWKDIPTPDAEVYGCGVYVCGRCYWTASLGFSFGGSSCGDNYVDDILSFDFTTEDFHCLHSPPSREEREGIAFEVCEYRGSLGAIGFSVRVFGFFEFWVREECSWTKIFDVSVSNVERIPLGLIDGRFLFLEREASNKLCQLVVYDRITKELKELDIYDYCCRMEVTRYVEGQVALPDAMPMQRSYTHEEEKQMKKRRRERSNDYKSDDDDDSCEDEEEDDDNEEEEEDKQIKKRRRERCNDYKSDDDDDSCEDDDDNEEEEDNVDEDS